MESVAKVLSHLWLITRFVAGVTWQVPIEEQELPTLPEHLSLPPVFSMLHVARSLVSRVAFCRSLFFFCSSSFGCCLLSVITASDYPVGIFKMFLYFEFVRMFVKFYKRIRINLNNVQIYVHETTTCGKSLTNFDT